MNARLNEPKACPLGVDRATRSDNDDVFANRLSEPLGGESAER